MSKVIEVSKVEATSLWIELNAKDEILARNIVQICSKATDRMKLISKHFDQYTLHDEAHLLRVTELMAMILGSVMTDLNKTELALLILAAFMHDQGMVPTEVEYANIENDDDYKLFKDNWYIKYPNHRQITDQIASQSISAQEREQLIKRISELNSAMLTEYLRSTHAQRSADYVNAEYGTDDMFKAHCVNLASYVGSLCKSHSLWIKDFDLNGEFRYDESIGTDSVNMAYLAVILRLADILDFDRDRTPESLYRTIHFTSKISIDEWDKHRTVHGWKINDRLIRFTMKSEHPAYQAAAYRYMDMIDLELSSCHDLCNRQPQGLDHYKLHLPSIVNRDRIEPKNGAYRYHDLEFKLSRDEIIRLLMTDKLYGSPSLCIRELLQNALDAIRLRKANFSSAGNRWEDGKVEFEHSVDVNGYEIIQCIDNGSGMDEHILKNYFVKVGNSYYRSPEFERTRNKLKKTGNDFDPCSMFGIGFMSCFMLGDHITIETRKDNGLGQEYGPPLIVEMNGLGGLFIIRDGKKNQPIGTKVTIQTRKKPAFLDKYEDRVNLIYTLKKYAVATEFPIHGRCVIPEIADEVEIPTTIEPNPTVLELYNINKCITIEKNFSSFDKYLNGAIRESFLIDDNGIPCLENDEAKWVIKKIGNHSHWEVEFNNYDGDMSKSQQRHQNATVSIDGILVAGMPARNCFRSTGDYFDFSSNGSSHIDTGHATLLNVTGPMKPELTPAREPEGESRYDLPPKWKQLQNYSQIALGQIWGDVLYFVNHEMQMFWKLVSIYNIYLPTIQANQLWDNLSVALKPEKGRCSWKKVKDIGPLIMIDYSMEFDSNAYYPLMKPFQLYDSNNKKINVPVAISKWELPQNNGQHTLHWKMNFIVLLLCSVDLEKNRIMFVPTVPEISNKSLFENIVNDGTGSDCMVFLDYTGNLSDVVAVEMSICTANRKHPLSDIYKESRFHTKSDLQRFATDFIITMSYMLCTNIEHCLLDNIERWHKIIAHKYFSVDWDKYDDSLKPPYKIWRAKEGFTEITEETFKQWRDAPEVRPD